MPTATDIVAGNRQQIMPEEFKNNQQLVKILIELYNRTKIIEQKQTKIEEELTSTKKTIKKLIFSVIGSIGSFLAKIIAGLFGIKF